MVIFIDRRLFVLYNNKNGVGEDAIAKIQNPGGGFEDFTADSVLTFFLSCDTIHKGVIPKIPKSNKEYFLCF